MSLESTVPLASPTVVIDKELQQKYTSLQFNPRAFYDFAGKAGFTDKEIAGLTIHFTASSQNGLAGKYLPRIRKVEIYLDDIVQNHPKSTGKLQPKEYRLPRDKQYSRVLSRVIAHEVGHHSRAGRYRGRLATAGTNALLSVPIVTASIGALYTSVTGSLTPSFAALIAETAALAALSYRYSKHYGKQNAPEKLFNYHRRRFSEKPAFAAEFQAAASPLVSIEL